MRSVVRALGTLIAVLVVAAGPVLALPAARASAAPKIEQRSFGTVAASSHTLAISITGMSPRTATQNSTVTVRGTLANHTGSAIAGITVQAKTSTANIRTRSAMDSFVATGTNLFVQPAGNQDVTATVPDGATVSWSVSFEASLYYDRFGVYPVQVAASVPGTAVTATAQTLLPYWDPATKPEPLQTAWIWPLVDIPQQGACVQTLATSALSGSVAAGGRLSTLLDAGAAWTKADHLTWNIDPALLSDVSVMTRDYATGGSAKCTGRSAEEPSKAAATWLSKLQQASAGQPAFLTSYANVDVAALSHAALDQNIRSAYLIGRTVAGQLLPHTFGTDGKGAGGGTTVLRAAWPADGLADRGTATSLASDAGINTLVLASGQVPSSTPPWDNALGKTTSDIGTPMSALLADSEITSLLGSASQTASASKQFALIQDFLAQTAMISDEAPTLARSLVIAPPSDWDPSPAEARALLAATDRAPWLHKDALSALAGQAAKLPSKPLRSRTASPDELTGAYLNRIRAVGTNVSLFKSLIYQPPASLTNRLAAAVAATASSAWRGDGAAGGGRALRQLSGYLTYLEGKVQIVTGSKILLAGASGETPVSVLNGLAWPVQVRVVASAPPGSQLQVGSLATPFMVLAGKSHTVRLPVHSAAIGTTTLQLQLVAQDGSPLTWTAKSLSVEVTRFGRSLLIVIGSALGILVLTSAYRLHRKRKAGVGRDGTPDQTPDAGGAG